MSEKEFAVGDDFNFLGTVYVIQSFDENGISLKKKPVELLKIEGKLNGAPRKPETVIEVWAWKSDLESKENCFELFRTVGPTNNHEDFVKATLTIPAPEKKMVKRVMYQSVFKSDGNAWIDLEGELFHSKEKATKQDGAIGVVAVEVELFAEGE